MEISEGWATNNCIVVICYLDMLRTDNGQDADWIAHSRRGNNILERDIGGKIEGRIPGC